jgi:ATP-dependent helicase/nuclease subunit A
MKNVEYISAGAGSGKTYTITNILAGLIADGAKPQEMVLATFTNLAADELREKARAVLCEQGKYEESVLLDQAMIGTIHSVANLFICKYWYYLGLNAKLSVMPDEDKAFYINQSLADLATNDDIRAFRKFRDYFNIGGKQVEDYNFWKQHIRNAISIALANGISDFGDSSNKSKAMAREVFGTDDQISATIDSAKCHDIVSSMLQQAQELEGDSGAANGRRAVLQSKISLSEFSIDDISEIAKQKWTKNVREVFADELAYFQDLISNFWKSKETGAMLCDFIDRSFRLAAKFLKQYGEYKRSKSIIDYDDMEQLFYRLLTEHKEIGQEISGRYKYVFVDEFQDCNPIQVKIFDKLSDLVEKTYWVGDAKQAIYGFRGTDTELTRAVADRVKKNFEQTHKSLSTSYRSLPDIVSTVNKFFSRVFIDKFHMLDGRGDIELNPHRKADNDAPQLVDWLVKIDTGATADSAAVAGKITSMVAGGTRPQDIAILCRSNSDCDKYAAALGLCKVPVSRGSASALSAQNESILLCSILSLIVDNHDDLAKAQILYLTEKDTPVQQILDDRLAYRHADDPEQEPWQNSNAMISHIIARSKSLAALSVSALVETINVEFGLSNIVSRWGDAPSRKANLESLVALAQQYEQHCQNLTLGASVTGFLDYVASSDMTICGDSTGVFVNTYHKSKGLQWNTVILSSLDFQKKDESSMFFGERTVRANTDSDALIPSKYITLLPFLWVKNPPMEISDVILKRPDFIELKQRDLLEQSRLMYVGMTRARDQLVFISKEHQSKSGYSSKFAWLTDISDIDGESVITVPTSSETECDILGTGIPFQVEVLDTPADDASQQEDSETCKIVDLPRSSSAPEATLRYQSPSTMAKTSTEVSMKHDFGSRINLHGEDDIQKVGDCIHNIFCVLVPADKDRNMEKARSLVASYGLQDRLSPEEVLSAYDAFLLKMREFYGEASKIYHELEFAYPEEGSIVRGSMDFVYETPEGCVLVDFKSNPMGHSVLDKTSEHYAGNYNTQFCCYAAALNKAGKAVIERLVYYPVNGFLVSLKQ